MIRDAMAPKLGRRALLRLMLGLPLLLASEGAYADFAPRRKPRAPRRLVLDPGHGGRDPGAIGLKGTEEKDIVLDIARRLQAALADAPNLEVTATRLEDRFIPLRDRVAIARERNADLFISLHADSAPNRAARGLSAYTLSETASDDFAKAIADQENLVDAAHGVETPVEDPDVAAILRDLVTRHTRNAALTAKGMIVQGAGKSLKLLENPMRSANFVVLRAPDVPSLLIETGFLSNPKDESLLTRAEERQRVAEVLAREISRTLNAPPFG